MLAAQNVAEFYSILLSTALDALMTNFASLTGFSMLWGKGSKGTVFNLFFIKGTGFPAPRRFRLSNAFLTPS